MSHLFAALDPIILPKDPKDIDVRREITLLISSLAQENNIGVDSHLDEFTVNDQQNWDHTKKNLAEHMSAINPTITLDDLFKGNSRLIKFFVNLERLDILFFYKNHQFTLIIHQCTWVINQYTLKTLFFPLH